MSRFKNIQQFVTEANRVTELNKLQNLLDGTVKALGFDYYALVNRISPVHRRVPTVCAIDYPEAWVCTIRDKGYFVHDPVHIACQKSAAPFTFAQVPDIVKLTALQKEILESARHCGLGSGFVVPIHIPGENIGSCTFSVRVGRDIPRRSFPAALYVGLFAFEAARRVAQRLVLKKSHSVQDQQLPRLTKRELDCVVLAGRGKTDHDVAQLLGISEQTVHGHIEHAKRKYDVATRTQLVVRVLFDNQLSFADLVH